MQAVNDVGQRRRSAAIFGATGGIGSALCQALGRDGWSVAAGSRGGQTVEGATSAFPFDITDEGSVEAAANFLRTDPPELVVVATGLLSFADGTGPERSLRHIDPDTMAEAFRINTIGPALVAKHVLPLFPRGRAGVFAAIGARVGSITDNRLGGWHSYRASKAALAMLIRNFAIECARTHPDLVIMGLHPGTVDTPLSEPFQSNLPEGQLQSPEEAAARLLAVMTNATPQDSGNILDWQGKTIPA